jgi:hypothetical protein
VRWEGTGKDDIKVYDFSVNTSKPVSTFPAKDISTFFLLHEKNHVFVTDKFFSKDNKDLRTIVENGTQWKNTVEGYDSNVSHNGKNVWLWDRKALIIDDNKISLPISRDSYDHMSKRDIRDVIVSNDGKNYIIKLWDPYE